LNPYVFGPHGSGAVVIRTDPDPDPSIGKQNILKILISTVLRIPNNLLYLKNDVKVPMLRRKQKKRFKKLFFVGILTTGHWKKSNVRNTLQ
jgi:hypothetical protein